MSIRKLTRFFSALALIFSVTLLHAGDINLNTASANELAAAMKGIGQTKAEAIVAYRNQHGPFQSVDQLTQVKGVGAKTLEKNRELLTVADERESSIAEETN